MSDSIESNEERPCLHCLIGDVIDDFYAEYGSLSGEKDNSGPQTVSRKKSAQACSLRAMN